MANVYWAVCLKNSVAIICWTFLAYYFGYWWIALFGVLFMSSVEMRNKKGHGEAANIDQNA